MNFTQDSSVSGLGEGPPPAVAAAIVRLKVFLAMLDAYVTAKEFAEPVEFDDFSALRRIEEIDRLNDILAGHDALYRETIRGDRFQASRYTWDRCIPLRREWKRFVSSAVGEALAGLDRWTTQAGADDFLRARLEQAKARIRHEL